MKNRKAKILLVRRNAPGVWQWVRLSNRRMGLMKYYGMMDCGFLQKAQRGAKPLEKPLAH
ncbi:prophage protein [Escherichia coli]|uniref:Prophage protein n=1 Tax=Escherichia coli TaxID=562 RepID=A0A376WUP0_ECOLX|nr:prophage protein [Escherichia coli]